MKASSTLTDHLTGLVEEHASALPGVSRRRMFGCDAFFREGTIFSLIWKTGRIGLKLTDEADHREVLSMKGAEPWSIGAKTMGNWVLVPEAFHDDVETLAKWVARAHAQAEALPNAARVKARVAKKKQAASATAAKKAPPKKTAGKRAPAKKARP